MYRKASRSTDGKNKMCIQKYVLLLYYFINCLFCTKPKHTSNEVVCTARKEKKISPLKLAINILKFASADSEWHAIHLVDIAR